MKTVDELLAASIAPTVETVEELKNAEPVATASRINFAPVLESVLRAAMRWRDVIPQGRRKSLGSDIETIDNSSAGSLSPATVSLATFWRRHHIR
ncbi:hypothetical protein BU15DRAFT_82769 [Melanogaster broomeanus]|nr:hypothetical protein BU15DRAFT_82769 [Melanogaster broomeanus]